MEPTMGEAMASYYAACFSRDFGAQKLVLEGDAMKVVKALQSSSPNLSRYGHVIEDTKNVLSSMAIWRSSHFGRESNNAAHVLAKMAVNHLIDKGFGWIYYICDIIVKEQNALFH
jgi:hypothetical protein